MVPTQTDALPSSWRTVPKSTGDTVAQLWDTGKLNSTPSATHAPRYATSANLIAEFA